MNRNARVTWNLMKLPIGFRAGCGTCVHRSKYWGVYGGQDNEDYDAGCMLVANGTIKHIGNECYEQHHQHWEWDGDK